VGAKKTTPPDEGEIAGLDGEGLGESDISKTTKDSLGVNSVGRRAW